MFFIKVKNMFLCFYLQINVFNIYGLICSTTCTCPFRADEMLAQYQIKWNSTSSESKHCADQLTTKSAKKTFSRRQNTTLQ